MKKDQCKEDLNTLLDLTEGILKFFIEDFNFNVFDDIFEESYLDNLRDLFIRHGRKEFAGQITEENLKNVWKKGIKNIPKFIRKIKF